jgi:hypothetical protein
MFIDETYLEGLSEVEKQKVHQIYDALCTPEDRLWNEICRGLKVEVLVEAHNRRYLRWCKGDVTYFTYDATAKVPTLNCNDALVWESFKEEFNWGYRKTQDFIRHKVEPALSNGELLRKVLPDPRVTLTMLKLPLTHATVTPVPFISYNIRKIYG